MHQLGMTSFSVYLLLIAALFFQSCADDSDAGEIAGELAERLTAALEFDGSEVVDEMPPPVGDAGEEAQITELTAPDSIRVGEPFVLEVTTDWPKPEEVNMAVVWVKGSSRHIWVTQDIYPEGASFNADMGGLLKNDPELVGKTFIVAVSLQLHTQTSGEYVEWEFEITE